MEKHIETLEKLLDAIENGDEDGFTPDLTIPETEAIRWAKEKIVSIREFYSELFLP